MTGQHKGILFGLIATAFWASFYPLGRVLFGFNAEAVDPLNFTFLRFAFATLFFLPLLFQPTNRRAVQKLLRQHWGQVLLLSAIGIVGEGLLVFWSLKYTTSARASLLANASPIFTVLISYFCGRELLNGRRISGMILGFLGILLAFQGGGGDVFSADTGMLAGDLMALLSGVGWAYYTVFGTEITACCGGMLGTGVLFACGTLLMLPVLILSGSGPSFDLPWRVWLGAFYLGALSNGLANGLWYMALKYVTPGELGSCGYISALLTFALAVFFLDEQCSWQFLVAIGLVLGGVALMLQREKLMSSTTV
ncbi:MAG: DMT family transporter [Oligosphaeraceae bacterium]|nr:DMT family transporter [Oligosphaeraceae bacterium]